MCGNWSLLGIFSSIQLPWSRERAHMCGLPYKSGKKGVGGLSSVSTFNCDREWPCHVYIASKWTNNNLHTQARAKCDLTRLHVTLSIVQLAVHNALATSVYAKMPCTIFYVLSAQMYYPPTPFFCQSYVEGYSYIVSAHPLPRDCSLHRKWQWQQASRWQHVHGFEKSRFLHSSLDHQLRLSIIP